MAIKRTSNNSLVNATKMSTGFSSAAIPNTPTIGTATKVNDVSATITYTAAVLGATATSFSALSTPGSLTGTGSSPITISGLTPETSYTFTVRATNANGNSAYSSASNEITTDPVLDSGAMFPLGMVQVGSAGAANITFSSIPATYKHLQIRYIGRTDFSTAGADFLYSLNSDTTNSNYAYHRLGGEGSVAFAQGSTSSRLVGINNGANAGASMFAAGVMDILDYANTSKNKTIRNLVGSDRNGSGLVGMYSNLWMNTNAVTTISLIPENGNWVQYSQFALYGIKGA